jgi:translation initiation factor 2B subunit (eIF-2B alpha/beta/delta family)
MVNRSIVSLRERFQRLELHAAHSGREVLRALIDSVSGSKAENLDRLEGEIREIISFLLPALPPYAPPLNSINRIMLTLEEAQKERLPLNELKEKIASLEEITAPQDIHEVIATYLLLALPQRVTIYTHTLSETVLGVLLYLHSQGRIKRVFVTESRPNNDGWTTATKLTSVGVETLLTIDAGFPEVAEKSDIMLSGAEIINQDGSVVCKVGVYPAAMYCRRISIPVYIIADTNKISPFDKSLLNFTPLKLKDIGLTDDPGNLRATGSYFDVTPAEFVTGYGTERGLLSAKDVALAAQQRPVSKWLKSQLQANP